VTRTGAKFSAWPLPSSRSTSTLCREPTRPFSQAALRRAVASRSRRARALTSSGSTRGMRAAGVPRLGEKGKIWPMTMSHSSISRRLRRCIASVSVGKPAMRSAPIAISGRLAFRRATVAIASARRWRRFIRFSTISSPA
jgi:hypothetical protein